MSFLEQIEPLKQAALADLRAAPDLAALDQAKGVYLGAQGKFTALLKQLGALPKEEKPAAGKLVNLAKIEIETALTESRAQLELKAALPKDPTDFTLPGRRRALGHLHPLTQVTEDIVRSFRKIGFVVADGPEIEDEYHCFDALNTPADHPARDSQDTFYISNIRKSDEKIGESRYHAAAIPEQPTIDEKSASEKIGASKRHTAKIPDESPRLGRRPSPIPLYALRTPHYGCELTPHHFKSG